MTSDRYAIYFAPDSASELWQRGSRWLGRDAARDQALERPALTGPEALRTDGIVTVPAEYGFHATLKPPFRLAAGQTPDRLLRFAASFAEGHAPVALAGLRVAVIGRFVALVPAEDEPRLGDLADDCVTEFERFRAPLDAGKLARRRQAGLAPRQVELLEQWGYPYVMEEFRFHMTLTGPLAASDREAVRQSLEHHFADIAPTPLPVDAIAIFAQAGKDRPFRILKRFPLTGR